MRKLKHTVIIAVCVLTMICSGFSPAIAASAATGNETTYVLNTNTKKFHLPDCSSVSRMSARNRRDTTMSYDEVIDAGYDPCGNCHPDRAQRTAGSSDSSRTAANTAVNRSTSGSGTRTAVSTTQTEITYVLNTNTMKFHRPGCSSVSTIKEKNREDTTMSYDEVIAEGYSPCGRCHPN